MRHHDALEFPDGQVVLLTFLKESQQATVLQLPATEVEPKTLDQAAYVCSVSGQIQSWR
jgi:hypothetical protein